MRLFHSYRGIQYPINSIKQPLVVLVCAGFWRFAKEKVPKIIFLSKTTFIKLSTDIQFGTVFLKLMRVQIFFQRASAKVGSILKVGVYLKMSGNSDFLFSLKLASATIGLDIGKSCFGYFQNLMRMSCLHTRGV